MQTSYLGFKSIIIMFEVSSFLFQPLHLGSQLLQFFLQKEETIVLIVITVFISHKVHVEQLIALWIMFQDEQSLAAWFALKH